MKRSSPARGKTATTGTKTTKSAAAKAAPKSKPSSGKPTSSSRRTKAKVSEATKSVRRRTPGEARILRSKGLRRAAGIVVGGVFASLVFTLGYMPIRDFFGQRAVLAQKQTEYDTLSDATEELQTEVNKLQTPEGVRNAARTQLNMVYPGEKRVHLLPSPALPTQLPQQWPYTMVSGIVAVRSNIAAANNAPLAPLSP